VTTMAYDDLKAGGFWSRGRVERRTIYMQAWNRHLRGNVGTPEYTDGARMDIHSRKTCLRSIAD
jgi:hypothetical protein